MFDDLKIYCEYDELVLKELGLDQCECGRVTNKENVRNGVCGECEAINAGTHNRCKCGRIKSIQYAVCLHCKGYRRATI
jgi:hypothetical protein